MPNKLKDTINKPDTAPPRKATVKASLKLRLEAAADLILVLTATDIPTIPETAEEIAPKIIAWRDEILKYPIEINYLNMETNNKKIGYYCIKKYDNVYLVADLTKPVNKETQC